MDVSRYGQLKVFSRARSTSSASCSASAEGLSSRYWTTTQKEPQSPVSLSVLSPRSSRTQSLSP